MTKVQVLIPALLLCLVTLANAEIATGAGTSQNNARATGTLNWSGAPEKTDINGSDITKDLPTESKMLSDHLVGDDAPGTRKLAPKSSTATTTPSGVTGTSAIQTPAPSPKANPIESGNVVFDSVKDIVKPIKEQLDTSEVVQAVREFDAAVAGKLGENNAAIEAQKLKPLRSGELAQHDQAATELAYRQLLDEIKPWVFGLISLAAIGYIVSLVWNILRLKSKGSGKRRSSNKNVSSRPMNASGESAGESRGSKESRKRRSRRTQNPGNVI